MFRLILAEQDSGPGWGRRLRPARIDFNMERLRGNDEAIDELIPTDDQKVKRRDAETHEQGRDEMLRSDCVENGPRTTSEVSLTTRSDTKE